MTAHSKFKNCSLINKEGQGEKGEKERFDYIFSRVDGLGGSSDNGNCFYNQS